MNLVMGITNFFVDVVLDIGHLTTISSVNKARLIMSTKELR